MRLMLITDLKMFSNKQFRKPVGEGNPTGLFFKNLARKIEKFTQLTIKNEGKQFAHKRLPSRR